jgi:hypothetical protein
MMRQFTNLWRSILPLLMALGAVSLATAQSDPGDLITLAVKAIDGKTIQLVMDDGKTFTFALDAETVYCQGENRALDWTYLKEKMVKKATVSVKLSKDKKKALVVWDQGPSMVMSFNSPGGGNMSYHYPPMCKGSPGTSSSATGPLEDGMAAYKRGD